MCHVCKCELTASIEDSFINSNAGLSNVDVIWARAEEAGQRPDLREAYDLSVARAVAETRVLAELCLPFVRVGGLWVAPKGPGPQVGSDYFPLKIGGLENISSILEPFSTVYLPVQYIFLE